MTLEHGKKKKSPGQSMIDIEKIGVVGEGKMGTSIFLYLNGFNFKLSWLCSSENEKIKAEKTWYKKTKLLYQSGVLTEEEFFNKSENTTFTDSVSDMEECDLIIEAIHEDPDAKKILFKSLDSLVNPDCIFASNSSSIIPSILVPSENRRDKFVGLHFFFPVALKKIVELITNKSVSSQTSDLLLLFLQQINKKPFIQDEANAFILNRLLLDFQAGAYRIFQEGDLSYREIDEQVRLHLFPVGIFEFFDHVGLDVMKSSIITYTQHAENKEFYSPLIQKLEELISKNHLGIKTKKGFFDYTHPETENTHPKKTTTDLERTKKEAIDRLWYYYTTSVSRVIEEGLCSREDLAYAVKDYLGIDTNPFERIIF
jgi:3-hydroxyacyl-CoA dehydrogenase